MENKINIAKGKKGVQYKFTDGSNVFFTSDTHWWHRNIIKFCNRPFKDVEEMNTEMIKRWNEVVPEDGIVFHLGDFSWGPYRDWANIRNQLNGRIILIKGNHDETYMTEKSEELFDHVAFQMKIEVEGRKVYLNHVPFLCYGGTYRDDATKVWQLFGHVHTNDRSNTEGKDDKRLVMLFPTQYDVGVDNNDFRPVSWKEVKEKIEAQIAVSNSLKTGEGE